MKITQVSYAMKRVTKPYENDSIEVVVQLEGRDTPEQAIDRARELCAQSLGKNAAETSRREKLRKQMSTPSGVAALDRFLSDKVPF